ncbi:MAG: toll/interleukin-1 receptor domain-containing protein [Sedimentisphaerales bacterium]|nr:toll/interleukin-1 receptor domain-containing protein [Sedimentisphaerales bacterium]
MVDDKILDRARRLIEARFEERKEILHEEINQVLRKMQIAGHLGGSSVTWKLVHRAYSQEVQAKAEIVWECIQKAHSALGSPITEMLATDLKEEVSRHIEKIVKNASEFVVQRLSFMKQYVCLVDLESTKRQVKEKLDVEVDLYVDSLTMVSKNSESLNAGIKTIFISHANEDAALAEIIKIQIDNVFEKKISVFVSSIPGTIKPGSDWFDKILGNLTENNAFVVLVTPYSEKRPFVWFEIGFSWFRRIKKNCEIYAICAPPINHGNLPEPLCRLQAISLADEKQTKAFFAELTQQFDLGNLDTLDFSKIQDSLPTYPPQITQSGNIDTRFIHFDNLDGTGEAEISGEAKTMLLEAINDENGYILKIRTTNGTSIKTNGRNLIPNDDSRTVAKWVNALDELVNHDFVEECGQNGSGFAVTHKGYEYADTLRKS